MTYLRELANEIQHAVPPHLVPPEADELFLIYATLVRSKGVNVTPEDVHDAWVAWMEARGETHPSMIPFSDLPPRTRQEDDPFVQAIALVARRHHR